jgi:hypothetical protein
VITGQYSSTLQPDGALHYLVGAGFALHSPILAELGVQGDVNGVRIERGDVFLSRSLRWMSPLMALHAALVFLGLCPLGRSSLNFRYGLPWGYKASLIRQLLMTHRAKIAVSRRQVATVFTAELRLVRFPLAGVVGFVAGVFLPRRDWQIA